MLGNDHQVVQALLFVIRVCSPSQVESFHQPLHLECLNLPKTVLSDQLETPASDRRIGFPGRGKTSRRENCLKSPPGERYEKTIQNYRQGS